MSFTILTVCTGNICRSPLSQLVLTRAVADLRDVYVESAGSEALIGHGMPEPALALAREYGLEGTTHRARQLTESIAHGADLILAMSREHRRAIVELAPATLKRTFTVRELANVAPATVARLPHVLATAETPTDALRAAVALAATLRGTVRPPADPSEWDVVDPYRKSDETYAISYSQLAPATVKVADILRAAVA